METPDKDLLGQVRAFRRQRAAGDSSQDTLLQQVRAFRSGIAPVETPPERKPSVLDILDTLPPEDMAAPADATRQPTGPMPAPTMQDLARRAAEDQGRVKIGQAPTRLERLSRERTRAQGFVKEVPPTALETLSNLDASLTRGLVQGVASVVRGTDMMTKLDDPLARREHIQQALKGKTTASRIAAWLDEEAERRWPGDPLARETFLSQVVEALGTSGIFAAGGLVLGPAAIAGLGVMTAEGQLLADAKQSGAKADDVLTDRSQLATIGGGLLETIPIERALGRLVPKSWKGRVADILLGGGEEGLQEGIQQIAQNFAAQSYDEQRDILEGLEEAARIGGGSGMLLNAIIGALGGRGVRRPRREPIELPTPAPSEALSQQIGELSDEDLQRASASPNLTPGEGEIIEREARDRGTRPKEGTAPAEPPGNVSEAEPGESPRADPTASRDPSPGSSTEAELERIAEESTDLDEIESAYRMAAEASRVATPAEDATAEYLKAHKIAISSYEDFGDPNTRTPELTKTYLRKAGRSVDQAAMEISELVGREVTPQDIIDFIDRHPRGPQQFRQSLESATARRLRERYRALTGKPVPPPRSATREEIGGEEEAPFAPVRELSRPADTPTGRHEDRIRPAPITGKKPKPLKQIRLDLEKAIGVKVRAAKTKTGVAGTYFPGVARTIIRFQGDLDTTAHEVAHALDDQFGIVAEWAGTDKKPADESPFDSELIPRFAFTGSGGPKKTLTYNRAEGVAEWVRAWVVNPEEAVEAAPKFAAFFEKKVPAKVLRALDQFSNDVRTFAGGSAEQRTLANVESALTTKSLYDRLARSVSEGLTRSERGDRPWVTKLAAEAVDRLRPVMVGYEYARTIKGIEHVLPEKDLRILARTFAGANSKVDDVFDHGMTDARGRRISGVGGIDWLLEPLDSSSAETLDSDYGGTISLLINERILEKAQQLDRAATRIEQKGAELAGLPALIEEQREKLRKVRAELAEFRRRQVRDGSIGRQKERVSFERSQLQGLLQAQAELKKEIAREKRRIGFTGSWKNVRKFVQLRKERLAGTGAGIYSDERQAVEALQEAARDPERLERLKVAAARYRRWADALLQYMRDKGRISETAYRQITSENTQYVSLQRIFEETDPAARRAAGRHLGRIAEPVRRFRGSTREIRDPYVSLMMQTSTMIREADRNEAMLAFRSVLTSERQMYEGDVLKLERIGRKVTSKDNEAIRIFVNGEAEHWQFEEDIHQALEGLNDTLPNDVLYKGFAALPQLTRTFITHSPPFLIRNVLRDAPQRAVVSRTGSKPWGHLYFARPGGAKEFNETLSALHRYGGGQFGWYGASQADYYARLRKAAREVAGDEDAVLAFPKHVFEGYKKLAKLSEDTGRVAEFRKAFETAKNELGYDDYNAGLFAAYEARDILDYAVAGRVIRQVNVYVPFTNAAIQGFGRTLRAVKEAPVQTVSRWTYYVFSMEMMNYLWNFLSGDDEELRQQPAYLRDLFWSYKIGPNMWLRIPKPWEMGVFASGFSRAIDFTRGDARAFEGWAESALNAIAPLDEGALLGPYKSLVEAALNRDIFRDRPIVPPWESDLDLDLRKGTEHASRVGKLIQEAVGIDARKADFLIESMFGGIGRITTAASDLGREDKSATDQLVADVSGILVRSPVYAARDVQFVMSWARRRGKRSDSRVKELQRLLDSYYNSVSHERRDALGERIRTYASSVREGIESADQ